MNIGRLTFAAVPKPRVQLGVDVLFYAYSYENVQPLAKSEVQYIKSLGANALSISFPVFETGRNSSTVHATSATPSPEDLEIVASVAEKAGLYVSIRPLLDDTSLGGQSRTSWRPARLAAWFSSYKAFLRPYAKMAQRAKIPELINAAEFTRFQTSDRWRGLDRALRRVYKGTIAYANNWGNHVNAHAGGIGVEETVDAYRPIDASPSATVARLTAGWESYDRTLPAGTVETEVGIAAVAGAYRVPYKFTWNNAPLKPQIQTRWFTAVCNAAVSTHLSGIYFWALYFGQPVNVPPSAANPATWAGGPGAQAIAACFARFNNAN